MTPGLSTAFCFFFTLRRPPRSTLSPYTTLFRSRSAPSERTSSAFGPLVTAVTVAPRCFASCTAAEPRSEEHTSELQSRRDLVCRLLLEKKKRPFQRVSRDAAAPVPALRQAVHAA